MNESQMIVDILQRTLQMVNAHLESFTDAEMFVRPCPGANHATWQVGQFTTAEVHMIGALAGDIYPALPPGYDEKFKPETAKIDDPAKFPSKKELLDHFKAVRQATVQWVKTLSDEQLNKPLDEKWHRFAKTVGDMLIMQGMHNAMHIGQIQVIRRKLEKPVMF
jgi:hypothetical protein